MRTGAPDADTMQPPRGPDEDTLQNYRSLTMPAASLRRRFAVRSRLRSAADRVRHRDRAVPDFLILGAQKAGTTSLFDYLTERPGVEAPSFKEIHYFSNLVSPRHYTIDGPGWYRSHFPRRRDLLARGSITGEATPRYMVEAIAIERITRDLPDSKWIVVLRDPVVRAHSHHQMQVRRRLDSRSFDKAVKEELECIERTPAAAAAITTDVMPDDTGYVGGGRYSEQLGYLSRFRPGVPTLVLFCEDLFRGDQESFDLLHRFLGLPDGLPAAFPHLNAASESIPLEPTTRERLESFFGRANADLADRLRSDAIITIGPENWPDWVRV